MATNDSDKGEQTRDDRDRDDLQQRVDELESQVQQQAETIQQMLPSRREFLAGAAGGAGAAALGLQAISSSSDTAEAAQGDQGIGTETDPWPAVYTEYLGGGSANLDIDAQSVNTDDLSITNDGDGSGIDADAIDGYDVQKNGTDGNGIINFKT